MVDDIGMLGLDLVVSQRFLDFLKLKGLNHADIVSV